MLIRYFKEYYRLKPHYQDVTQIIAGVGLAGGIFLFWNVIGPLFVKLIQPAVGEKYSSLKVLGMLLLLPLSMWLAMLAMSMVQVLRKKLTFEEAIDFCCRFNYPESWLKEKSDITIRQEKIAELDEKLKG